MNLTVRIHDKEYTQEVAQGTTFTEEYNETLDSGTVRLEHINGQITQLRPYDDVYIYESRYDFDTNIAEWQKGGDSKDSPFYRHLLVDQFSENIINLSEGIFSYTIELFSETKGLETVQCPNISVTQPLNVAKKIDIYTYLVRFVNLYSPKIKTLDRRKTGCWTYTRKYSISPELKEIFSGYYPQDFTLSNPTLRDVLSTLMITRDMIPYVKDNVIYAKAISERTKTPWGEFSYDIAALQKNGMISRIAGQMTSSDYCDGVRRQYSDALSQDGTCTFVEYLGFRNNGNALMTLSNMRVETTHKIYKVKKMNMCWYQKAQVLDVKNVKKENIWALRRFDITPLVKIKEEWDLLSQDWRIAEKAEPKNIEDLSQYKISTISYSMGGTTISGWGERYSKPKQTEYLGKVFDIEKTYMENIVNILDMAFAIPEDVENEYIASYIKDKPDLSQEDIVITPLSMSGEFLTAYKPDASLSNVQSAKCFFFQIEYEGFYDGALIHSRDNGRDNIYQNDNVSASLTLLEKDGASQKEKLNRFANKTHVMNGRLEGVNYGVQNLLRLGNTGTIGADDDVIIYRREYSIFDNYILVSYAGIQDYVLKNFYTSVYAKYRVNQLMSYNESTNRAESRKVILLLSKTKKYKDEDTFFKVIDNNGNRVESKMIFSSFFPSEGNKHINSALISVGSGKSFYVDEQTFSSGLNLCFNIAMPDNASGGNFISNWGTEYSLLIEHPSDDANYYAGSLQDWYDITDDRETGAIDSIGFSLSHRKSVLPMTASEDKAAKIYQYLSNLPKKTSFENSEVTSSMDIYSEKYHKDNKEKINLSVQIEPIADMDISISDRFIELCDFMPIGQYEKVDNIDGIEARRIEHKQGEAVPFTVGTTTLPTESDRRFFVSVTNQNSFIVQVENSAENTLFSIYMRIGAIAKVDSSIKSTFIFEASQIYWAYRDIGIYKNQKCIILRGNGALDSKSSEILTELVMAPTPTNVVGGKRYDYTTSKLYEGTKPINQITVNAQTYTIYIKETNISKNMFVQYDVEKVNHSAPYLILPWGSSVASTFSDKKPSDVFSISGNGDESKIRIDVTDITELSKENSVNILNGIKSIKYWYLDFKSAYKRDYSSSEQVYANTNRQSGYYFVFGVNIYPEDVVIDGDKRYIDIYVSKTTNRDERVFDTVGKQIGVIHNCIDKDGNYLPPTKQAYDTVNNAKIGKITFVNNIGVKGWIATKGDYYYAESETIEASIDKLSDAAQITGKVGWTDENGNIYDTWELEYISDGNDHTFTAGIISD